MSRQSKSSGLSFLFNSLLSLAPFAPIAVAFHYTLYVSYSDSAVSLPCNSSPFPLQFCHLSRSLCSRPQLSLLNSVPHTPPTLSLLLPFLVKSLSPFLFNSLSRFRFNSLSLSLSRTLPLFARAFISLSLSHRLCRSCSDSFPMQLSLSLFPSPFPIQLSLSLSLSYATLQRRRFPALSCSPRRPSPRPSRPCFRSALAATSECHSQVTCTYRYTVP